ncbi:hypothetical protein Pcinc_032746 [Petrolisthes cinctipes]|uniref:Uncharacterized protein n=1 Tax=Petrolisthes cinctipes TaxID=88211 RepID=A0AAE1ETW0_PETCI|nr:hypothetical protein Pcinc_032746 [Petrolisthes cinctipes]
MARRPRSDVTYPTMARDTLTTYLPVSDFSPVTHQPPSCRGVIEPKTKMDSMTELERWEKQDLAWKRYRAHRAAIRERRAGQNINRNETERMQDVPYTEGKKPPLLTSSQRWLNDSDARMKATPSNTEKFLPMKQKKFDEDFGNSSRQYGSGGKFTRSKFNFAASNVLKETDNIMHKPEGASGGTGVITRAKARNIFDEFENRSSHLSFSGTKGVVEKSLQRSMGTLRARSREPNVKNTTGCSQKNTEEEMGQMCRRALQFDSNAEVVVMEEDFTQPLSSMNMTPIISKASVFKAPFNKNQQQQAKENNEPKIKETLPQPRLSRFQMVVQSLNLKIPEVHDGQKPWNVLGSGMGLRIPAAQPKCNTGNKVAGGDSTLHKKVKNDPQSTSKKETQNICRSRLFYSSSKTRSAKKFMPTRLARRSLIPAYSQVPAVRNLRSSRAKGTSESPSLTSDAQTAPNISTRKKRLVTDQTAPSRPTQRRSLAQTSSSLPKSKPKQQNVEGYITIPEKSEKDDEIITKDKAEVPTKVDASTNTTIRFTKCCSPDPQLKEDLQKIVEQMEVIEAEAKLVWERTSARRQEMREAGLLQSLTTTSSPLKRLRSLIKNRTEQHNTYRYINDMASDNMESQSPTSKDNTNLDKEEEEEDEKQQQQNISLAHSENDDDLTCNTPNMSMEECSSHNTTYSPNQTNLNTTSRLNTSQMHWSKLKCDNRFLQTPLNEQPKKRFLHTSVQEKGEMDVEKEGEEEFFHSRMLIADGHSPFTQLVGDCERPSIAPMTPHSRQHISLLKLDFKKQLDELYD